MEEVKVKKEIKIFSKLRFTCIQSQNIDLEDCQPTER